MKHRILLILVLLPFVIYAQSVKELQQQRKQALQQLENTGKMLKETKRNESATVNKLNILNKDISQRKKLISTINAEIRGLDTEMKQLQKRLDSLERELQSARDDYANLVCSTHYEGMQQSTLRFLLSSENFNQLVRRLYYMQQFAQYRKEQVRNIEQLTSDISEQKQLLDENRRQKVDARQTQQRERDKLSRDEKKQKQILSNLKSKEKQLLAQQKKQQKKADELNRQIEKKIADAQKASSTKKLTHEQQLLAGGFEKNKGRLPWPANNGFVSGQFGLQPDPVLKGVTRNNKGIYIQTTAGTAARAVYEGEVTSCFSDGQTNAVIIKHGNYYTVYANLTKLQVKVGTKVKAKQDIGTIYSDPENDNKTELLFQIWKEKQLLNPSLWLSK
ncbi:MAG: peptidoglycan DD-metalloendopeptidase family protein [Paludibacteraceae bacterium]|nr:peptidoglycan DD-metalloendopeptidase family protein [Paludibacteraceae bacterium]